MYTFESYRGKNLAAYVRYQSYMLLKGKGINAYFSVSEYSNKSTIKFKRKLNSKPIKLYKSIVIVKKCILNFTLKSYNSTVKLYF